jgi:hypothetical protein
MFLARWNQDRDGFDFHEQFGPTRVYLNVKPSLRQGKSKQFWARVMTAEIYRDFIPSVLSP